MCFEIVQKNKSQNAKIGVLDWWTNEYPKVINTSKYQLVNNHLKKKIDQIKKTKNYSLIKS